MARSHHGLTIGRLMMVIVGAGLIFAIGRDPQFRVCLIPATVAGAIAVAATVIAGDRPTMGRLARLAALLLAAPFGLATVVSWYYWGYPFVRPNLDRRIVAARSVEAASMAGWPHTSVGKPWSATVATPAQVEAFAAGGGGDPYYCLQDRVLIALRAAGTLPHDPTPVAPGRLDAIHAAVERTGRLEAGEEPIYDQAKELFAGIVEASGADGEHLVFVGARGGQVSNDHYPYYEFLFRQTGGANPTLELISFQRFYFDVAGIEGLEWPGFFCLASIPGLIFGAIVSCVIALLRRGRRGDQRSLRAAHRLNAIAVNDHLAALDGPLDRVGDGPADAVAGPLVPQVAGDLADQVVAVDRTEAAEDIDHASDDLDPRNVGDVAGVARPGGS